MTTCLEVIHGQKIWTQHTICSTIGMEEHDSNFLVGEMELHSQTLMAVRVMTMMKEQHLWTARPVSHKETRAVSNVTIVERKVTLQVSLCWNPSRLARLRFPISSSDPSSLETHANDSPLN
jgi:hypothetical protein